MGPASGSYFRLTRNRTGKVHSTLEVSHSHCVQTWGLSPRPVLFSVSGCRLHGLCWGPIWEAGPHPQIPGKQHGWGAGSMVPVSARPQLGGPGSAPWKSWPAAGALGNKEGWCRAPSSLGAARDVITRQHRRPTDPLPAHQPSAAPAPLWPLPHLFGWSTPHRPVPSPLSSDTSTASQRTPGTINSLASRSWLCWRPGGFPTTGRAAWLSEAWGGPAQPVQSPPLPLMSCVCSGK